LKVDVPSGDALKQLAYDLKAKIENAYIVLGRNQRQTTIAVMIDENVMKSNGLHAGNIVKEAAKEMWAAAAVTLRHSRRQRFHRN
jgi:alanyl-tRNA synthetase